MSTFSGGGSGGGSTLLCWGGSCGQTQPRGIGCWELPTGTNYVQDDDETLIFVPRAGTLRNLSVVLDQPRGANASVRHEIYVNDVASGLFAVSTEFGTEFTETSTEVSVNQFDRIAVIATINGGTPFNRPCNVSVEFA